MSEVPLSDPERGSLPSPKSLRSVGRLAKKGAILFMVLAGVAAGAHRPLLVGYARLFRVDNPAPSDALVVLTGSSGRNARAAAELYRRRVAGVVLLMRKPLRPFPDLNPSEVDRVVLIRHGVPPEAIRLLPPVAASESVGEEAVRMASYARRYPLRRVTVVTRAMESARAQRSFRRALEGTGVDVRAAAVLDPGMDETNWYRTDEGLVGYFRETLLTLYYRFSRSHVRPPVAGRDRGAGVLLFAKDSR
jgi:uncharacterized SAM-binding protein YcdF (DUF218 family)